MSSSRPLPSREDYWSEGETSVLIDEWGDRFMEFNRGSLRQGQWQEIADAVNSRPCDARRPPRTDLQCRNRVDTLKKKYKIEKNKDRASDWIFFKRMDFLLGPISASKSALRFSIPLQTSQPVVGDSDLYYSNGVGCDDSDSSGEILYRKRCRVNVAVTENAGVAVDELAKAIGKMVEVYEKVEMEKSRQMMELEKQRMELVKSIEIQRMKMVVDTLLSVKKVKGRKRRNTDIWKQSQRDDKISCRDKSNSSYRMVRSWVAINAKCSKTRRLVRSIYMLLFTGLAYFTGILLRRCLDSEPGLETYPDIGQAAFGMKGRLLV